MNMTEIAIDLIDEDADQPRYQFAEDALQELMRSIEELGLLSPIKVRTMNNGRYKIIYGNRRYKACKELGKSTIPCIVSTAADDRDIYLEQIAENLTREGFSPIEEAEAFDKLLNNPKFSVSVKFLSGKLGKTEAYIKKKCELLKFGPDVKKRIAAGTEIRKDLLTEEQLLPIKDLDLAYRDPLALIIARDELPVSDVKKIAQLFKDNSISDSTKNKLLYKNGAGLVETWSVIQNNKAERAKPDAAAATSSRKGKTEQSMSSSGNAEAVPFDASPMSLEAVGPGPALTESLRQWLAAAPPSSGLAGEALQIADGWTDNDRESFIHQVDMLTAELEKQRTEWSRLRDLAASVRQT